MQVGSCFSCKLFGFGWLGNFLAGGKKQHTKMVTKEAEALAEEKEDSFMS